jgi:DNA-binding transcriptional regulator/RsmH inhibitor MraZ
MTIDKKDRSTVPKNCRHSTKKQNPKLIILVKNIANFVGKMVMWSLNVLKIWNP